MSTWYEKKKARDSKFKNKYLLLPTITWQLGRREMLTTSSQKTITAWFLNTPRLYDPFYSQKDNLRSYGQWRYCSLGTLSSKEKRMSWHLGSGDKILWYSSGKKKVDLVYNCKLEKVKMLLYFIFIYLWLLWVFTAAVWAFFRCDKHVLLSGYSARTSHWDGVGSGARGFQ